MAQQMYCSTPCLSACPPLPFRPAITVNSTAGTPGAVGQPGATGATGAPGSFWFTGAGVPVFVANEGDLFLDTTTGDVYQYDTVAGWEFVTNIMGPSGPAGAPGAEGPAGPAGPGVLAAADFFALMPPDNADTVAPGTVVDFPQDGSAFGTSILRASPSTFDLVDIGTYQIFFQVSVTEAGQLVVTLGGVEIPSTVVGRDTGTSQIVGMSLLTTTVANSIVSINNPAANPVALTITPIAGGPGAVSAHLVITRLA